MNPSSPYGSWRDVVRLAGCVVVVSGIVWCSCQLLIQSIRISTGWLFDNAGDVPSRIGALTIVGVLLAGGVARALLLSRPGWAITVENSINVAFANYRRSAAADGAGIGDRYEYPTFGLALRKAAATFLSIGTGGSGGLVAPMVTVGEAIGAGVARVVKIRSSTELRVCQLSAIAAAVATLLGAPFAAALFASEVFYRNQIVYLKLMYCLLAGVVAYVLGQYVFPLTPVYFVPTEPTRFGFYEYGITTMIAVFVSAPVAIAFSRLMTRVRLLSERTGDATRAVVGSLLTGGVAIVLWTFFEMDPRYVLGTGQGIVESVFFAEDPQLRVWWFLLAVVIGRMLTTAFSLAGSGSVGLLLPAVIFGGLSGTAVTELMNATALFGHIDPKLPVVVGIASALVGVIRVPLAAVALSIEVWSPAYGPAAALACATTYLISMRLPLEYQALPSRGALDDE